MYPDIVILPDSTSPLLQPLVRAVLNPGHDVRFIRDLFDSERNDWKAAWGDRREEFVQSFDVSDEILPRFWKAMQDQGIEIGSGKTFSNSDLRNANPTVATFLKARIAQQLYGTDAWFPLTYQYDADVMRALSSWTAAQELATYHGWVSGE